MHTVTRVRAREENKGKSEHSAYNITEAEPFAWCVDYPAGMTLLKGWPVPGRVYETMMPICTPQPLTYPVCILAHGAGAPMTSPFMTQIASCLAQEGIFVVRFHFSYMQKRQRTGTMSPPLRTPRAHQEWAAVVEMVQRSFAPQHLVIGGKSFGGRMAVSWAAGLSSDDPRRPRGLVVFGYPFHPSGRPGWDAARCQPLVETKIPTLIVQGTRDALGNDAFVSGLSLSSQARLIWIPDGDHSYRPRRASGYREEDQRVKAATYAAHFVHTGYVM